MQNKPKFDVGDKIVYKSGKRGYNYGLDNGMCFTVTKLLRPYAALRQFWRKGEWGGWVVLVKETNMCFPAGWFLKSECIASKGETKRNELP